MPEKGTLPKIVAVVGPTASGKTALAIGIAKALDGEVISADSRQFYRGMEIGSDTVTGTPGKAGRFRVVIAEGVPHHLVSFRSPAEPVTVAEFRELAVRRIRDILKRGKLPVICGGTGLYSRAVIDNFDVPHVPPDEALRARLDRKTTAALYRELQEKDPEYAGRIPPNNRRYAIRALEVIRTTGKPFSALQRTGDPIFDVLQLGIRRPREEMYRRIDDRVDALMENGLLEEAKRLGRRYGWDLPTMTGLGHRQLGMHLRGEVPLEEAVRLIKRDTRHFSRRQMTWFRRDTRIRWVASVRQALVLVRTFLKAK